MYIYGFISLNKPFVHTSQVDPTPVFHSTGIKIIYVKAVVSGDHTHTRARARHVIYTVYIITPRNDG